MNCLRPYCTTSNVVVCLCVFFSIFKVAICLMPTGTLRKELFVQVCLTYLHAKRKRERMYRYNADCKMLQIDAKNNVRRL